MKNMIMLLAAAAAAVPAAASAADKTDRPSDVVAGIVASTPEETAKRQARSVHLRYRGLPSEMSAVAVTLVPREVHPGTYFAAIGWNRGYCGLQELRNGKRKVIFSVWDPGNPFDFQAKPESVKEEHRAKVLYAAPGVEVSRFGGEGTGAKTMADFAWIAGEGVRFKVTCSPDGTDRMAYTCFVADPFSEDGWRRLATISTLGRGWIANGEVYSFVEDFMRNYDSAKRVRRAEYLNVEACAAGGDSWVKAADAQFTADATPSLNIDAGRVCGGGRNSFFLVTGGGTVNAVTRPFGAVPAAVSCGCGK